MISLLTLSLLLPATGPAIAPPATHEDPPIRVSLSDDHVRRGDRVSVKVKTLESGYLLVLRLDADGRVRVVFPVDPGDDMTIKGGHEMEIRGRGGRESFQVDEGEGVGTVLAARSAQPFSLDAFVKHGRWDYATLAVPRDSTVPGEQLLLELVDKMVGADQHYSYDVATYGVGVSPRYYSRGAYYDDYVGWHAPRYYSGCFDWYCDPWYYPRVGIGFRSTFFVGPRYYSRPAIGIGIGFRGRRRW